MKIEQLNLVHLFWFLIIMFNAPFHKTTQHLLISLCTKYVRIWVSFVARFCSELCSIVVIRSIKYCLLYLGKLYTKEKTLQSAPIFPNVLSDIFKPTWDVINPLIGINTSVLKTLIEQNSLYIKINEQNIHSKFRSPHIKVKYEIKIIAVLINSTMCRMGFNYN